MQQTIESPAKQMSIQLPAPLTDAELLWLGEHNDSLTFEQTSNRFGEMRGISGGVLLPKGGKYQTDGFVISAAA